MPLKGENGGDATAVIAEATQKAAKKATREAMDVWHAEAQKRVMEAASGRADIDDTRDSRGSLTGRQENRLHELAQEFTVPVWSEDKGAWVFAVTHFAAAFHEFGAEPHEIRARQARALVFEWPDMPQEVREKFEDQWASPTNSLEEPQVAFNSVEHPGVPGIGFMRYGRQQAEERLSDAGFDTDTFSDTLEK